MSKTQAKFIITFNNSGGPLESKAITASINEIEEAAGHAVIEMIEEAGCRLCDGDSITIREIEDEERER